jgi:hypothetical protein
MAAKRTWSFPSWLSSLLLVPAFFLLLYSPSLIALELMNEGLFRQLYGPNDTNGGHVLWPWQPTPAYYLFRAAVLALAVVLAAVVGRWAERK